MDDGELPLLPLKVRRLFRAAQRALHLVAPLVPLHRREEWVREWESELWHRLDDHARSAVATRAVIRDIVWRLAGALPHALWLRRHEWRPDMIGQDLKYAWRTTWKRPGFTALVVGTLALGIGAATAMFTIVNSVLIQPLPYRDAGQLIYMNGSFAKYDGAAISPPDFLDYRAANTVFSAFAARKAGDDAILSGAGAPERVSSSAVTANYFATLGVAPLLGRSFAAEEEEGGEHAVVMLSYGLWQRRFGGDPRVIGTTAIVGGRANEIIGVLPPVLDRTLDAELWQPLVFHTPNTTARRFHFLHAIGRLKPGVTLAQAQASMDVIAQHLASVYPENETWHLRLRPYRDVVIGDVGRALLILLGAVAVVLMIACGNVAGLLLARASSRQGEIAVRIALGASRTRLVRQLLTEAILYAVAGGGAGLALAVLLVHGVRVVAGGILPRLAEISVDQRVLLFAVLLSLVTGAIFGLAPALHAAGGELAASFNALGRTGSAAKRNVRLRDALVAGQVALSLVLLIGAGLLLRSLWQLQHVDTGFVSDHVWTAEVALPIERYNDAPALRRFWADLLDRTRGLPGVVDASAVNTLPLTGGSDTYYWFEGHPPTSEADRRGALINAAGDRYFETMRIPLVAGRTFGPSERNGGPNAIVISQQMAKRLFPGENAVGKRLVVDFGQPFDAEIVGVVGDVLEFGLNSAPSNMIYYSPFQSNLGAARLELVIRTTGNPRALTTSVRTALAAIDRDIPLADIQTMDDVVASTVSGQRFGSRVVLGFAATALLLAVVGLYGVLAYVVTQRTRELGIRRALGAPRLQLFGLVLGRGMRIVAIGIGIGLAASFVLMRLVTKLLYHVAPADPIVLIAMTASLGLAGLAACIIPARRATRIDPQVALRSE